MVTWGGGAPHPSPGRGIHTPLPTAGQAFCGQLGHNQSRPRYLHQSHTPLRMHTPVPLALRAAALQLSGEPTPPPPSLLCDQHPRSSAPPGAQFPVPFPSEGLLQSHCSTVIPRTAARRTAWGLPRASAQPLRSAHRSPCPLCSAGSRIACCLSSKSPTLSRGCPDPGHRLAGW